MGKIQAPLLPAPQGGLTKPAPANPVVGARDPINLQAGDFVGAWVDQEFAAGHVGAFVGEPAAGQNHSGADPRFGQARRAAHRFEGIHQHAGSATLDQEGAMAVAGDTYAATG